MILSVRCSVCGRELVQNLNKVDKETQFISVIVCPICLENAYSRGQLAGIEWARTKFNEKFKVEEL
jgi:DNA-directed RNA polymerase subunit RPC12/RpoP